MNPLQIFLELVGACTVGIVGAFIVAVAAVFLLTFVQNFFTACRAWKMSRGAGMNAEDHWTFMNVIYCTFGLAGGTIYIIRKKDGATFPVPMGLFPKKYVEEEFEDQ